MPLATPPLNPLVRRSETVPNPNTAFPWTEVKRMCEIILGYNFGHKELDSLALEIGHHPDVLNPPASEEI